MGLPQARVPQKTNNNPIKPYYLVGIDTAHGKLPRPSDREFLAALNALEGVPTKRIQHISIYKCVLSVVFFTNKGAMMLFQEIFSQPKTGPNQKDGGV